MGLKRDEAREEWRVYRELGHEEVKLKRNGGGMRALTRGGQMVNSDNATLGGRSSTTAGDPENVIESVPNALAQTYFFFRPFYQPCVTPQTITNVMNTSHLVILYCLTDGRSTTFNMHVLK